MSEPKTAEELAEAQAKEYGMYVAVEPIDVGNARAFNVGDAVPIGHVESGTVRPEQVAKRGTKSAATKTEPATK